MAKNDTLLNASMRSHRPRQSVAAEMSSTAFGQLEQEAKESRLIDVMCIVSSPYQSRGIVDEAHIESLMTSISEGGLINPIVVRPIRPVHSDSPTGRILASETKVSESDTFELVTGHNRLEAFKRIGRNVIPSIVRYMSDVEAARALTVDNTQHKGLTDWELFKHIQMLRVTKAVKNVTDLAGVLACSRATIYNLEAFGQFPVSLHELFDQKPLLIGGTLAYDLKPYCESHPKLVIEAIKLLADGKLKRVGVLGWVQRKIEPPVTSYRREIAFGDKNQTIKLVLTTDEARVSGDIDFEKLSALIEVNLPALRKTENDG